MDQLLESENGLASCDVAAFVFDRSVFLFGGFVFNEKAALTEGHTFRVYLAGAGIWCLSEAVSGVRF